MPFNAGGFVFFVYFCLLLLHLSRIPIPDLRPSPQLAPSEWWGRRLHKESLLLEIDHLTISRQDKPEAGPSAPSLTALMCSKVEGGGLSGMGRGGIYG